MKTESTASSNRSLDEVHSSVGVDQPTFWRRLFAFAGPAYLVSVGYMDPGNWATDLEGGARFGYELIWVLLMSNAMAVLLQTLSARLGLAHGNGPGPGDPRHVREAGAATPSGSSARWPSPPATWRRCWGRSSG